MTHQAGVVVVVLLLLSLKVLQQLQHDGRLTAASSPGAGSAPDRQPRDRSADVLQEHLETVTVTGRLLPQLLVFVLIVAATPSTPAPAGLPDSTCRHLADVPPVLARNAPAVCQALETFLRQEGCELEQGEDSEFKVQAMLGSCAAFDDDSITAQLLATVVAASGPGSQLQLQYFSLWASALKCHSILHPVERTSNVTITILCAETALFLLGCLHPEATITDSAAAVSKAVPFQGAGGVGCCQHNISSSMATASTSAATSTPARPSGLPWLMWLVLLGRCCLQWGAVLQRLLALTGNTTAADLVVETQQQVAARWFGHAAASAGGPTADVVHSSLHRELLPLKEVAELVQALLAPSSSTAQQLSSCGYDVTHVTEAAAAVAAALHVLLASLDKRSTAVSDLATAMEALGYALTSLAVPYCCNNPHCLNISGRSDVVLVSGKSCICGKCKVAGYCGKACQQQHWRLHKPVCKALAAAQAAAQLADTLPGLVPHSRGLAASS